ncbi:MAG: hypothetical protein AAF367_16590 [Pseudomonadota bacterium]
MTDQPDRIAQEIMRQHAEHVTFGNLGGDLVPPDIDAAYDAQFRLHELHGAGGPGTRGPLGGRKIALASAVQQKLCGIDHPIAGGIFRSEIHQSPAKIPLAAYHGLGLEFELACVLSRDLGPDHGPFDAHSIRADVASIHPAFEMIVDRGANYGDLGAPTMIADNAWCGGIVIGPPIANWRSLNVDGLTGILQWNDEEPVSARIGDADPFGSLAWVAGVLTDRGQILRAGEVIITGSVIKTRAPVSGDEVRYGIGDSAEVAITIT